ncbi:MAG: hypothetical protein RIR25_1252, partial [Verrucomicrobiota bacterium]
MLFLDLCGDQKVIETIQSAVSQSRVSVEKSAPDHIKIKKLEEPPRREPCMQTLERSLP